MVARGRAFNVMQGTLARLRDLAALLDLSPHIVDVAIFANSDEEDTIKNSLDRFVE